MNSEKNQLLFIVSVIVLLGVAVLMFLVIGGEFHLWFIRFSANGILTGAMWLAPILLIVVQQLFVVPSFIRSYWKLFSDEPPKTHEVYLPLVNESVLLQSEAVVKAIYGLWAAMATLMALMLSTVFTFFGTGGTASTLAFYAGLLVILCFFTASVIRGFAYLAARQDIYDYHNKYMGVRGTSPLFWIYKVLYFIPLARSISLLLDLQVMDKLTKFNSVERLRTSLHEE